MPPNYKVDFETSPALIDGARCLVASGPGAAFATGYRGELGGAVLAEFDARRRGLGASTLVLPQGLAVVSLGDPLPAGAAINPELTYTVTCLDPGGSDVNPVPTLVALAAEITPP